MTNQSFPFVVELNIFSSTRRHAYWRILFLFMTLFVGGQSTALAWQPPAAPLEATFRVYTANDETVGRLPQGRSPAHLLSAAPTLAYSSYLGGSGVDEGKGVVLDKNGNIYVIGETASGDFPGASGGPAGYSDIFVSKFNPAGTQLLYTTLIGSNDSDTALSIQVDDQGNVYATALVFDDDFPTKNALWAHPPEYWQNSVIFKLNQNGELVYSTYLPLDVFDARQNLAVDGNGNAYVTGSALIFSDEPPFLGSQIAALKLNPNGSQVLLNTHIGDTQTESGRAIDIDANGNIYLAGTTEGGEGNGFPTTTNAHQSTCGDVVYDPQTYCFEDGVVVVLNATGQVTYSSYHGGSFTDEPTAIATDGQGHVLIAGNTTSAQFPLAQPLQSSCPVDTSTENCYQARGFVSVIDINGSTGDLVYSTYLGSTERESNNVILAAAMDSGGTAYVTGYTNGKQFPVANPIQSQLSDNSFCTTFGSERYCFDAFVTVLSPSGGLSFGTYLGASFDEFPYGLALNPSGDIYLTGTTEANDFPVTANAFQATNPLGDDAFLVKIGSGGSNPPPAPGDKRVFLPMVIR